MIRWIVGHAFLRWGVVGALASLLAVGMAIWWALSALSWLVHGVVWVAGALAGFGYLVLLIAFVLWMRNRRKQEHLLGYGRRRW